MIFVCVGSRDYQFDRLIKKIDELVEEGRITDEVIAQIGQSTYVPKHIKCSDFLDADMFQKYQNEADLIISHGGTGALISALKKGKQVIAVPRYARFGEAATDHQTEISQILTEEGYLRQVLNIDDLGDIIEECYINPIQKKYDKPSHILDIIIDFIENNS